MPMHVRERLLHDPKYRQFQFIPESPQIRRDIQVHLNVTARTKTAHVPFQRRRQADFIQQRRMQQILKRTHFLHALLQQGTQIVE